MDLTYWLRKSPQPVTVMADDKRIDVVRNGRGWRDLTATIKAIDPAKLTCLDDKGTVIRSVVLESEDDKPSAAPASPEMSDLQLFAKLLAEGYQHGMRANQPIIDSAMQFVERQAGRVISLEREVERLRQINHKQAMQIAELTSQPAPTEEGGLIGSLVAGVLQAQQQQAQTTPANGITQLKGGVKK